MAQMSWSLLALLLMAQTPGNWKHLATQGSSPSLFQEFSLLNFLMSYASFAIKDLFYWPLCLTNISWSFTQSSTSGQPSSLPQLPIAEEGQDCGLWLGQGKTASREQHLLGNSSFIKQEGHAFISLQSWCAIPLLGWRLRSVQLWPFAAQQNLLLKWVLPLY